MLTKLLHHIRIYSKLEILHLRAALEYEADFWVSMVGMALTHTTGFLFVWAFFHNVPQIAGWGLWDTAFLYGLSVLPRGLAEVLTDGAWMVRALVNRGELDRLLVRPISPLVQLIAHESSLHGFSNILVGGAILLRALFALDLTWTFGDLLLLGLTLLSALVMITAISLATNSIAFWEPSSTGSFPVFIYNFQDLTKFPLEIYDRGVRMLLTWVLPFALVSYYPGLVLLDKPGINPWLGYLSPLAALVVAAITGWIWQRGLARYQGTGH